MYCTSCGKKVEPGDRFCTGCGKLIKELVSELVEKESLQTKLNVEKLRERPLHITEKRAAQANKADGIKEIKVKTSNINEIRIGFIDPDFSRVFREAAWDVIASVNPLLVKTLQLESKYVMISSFRESSMDQLIKKASEWSKTFFSGKDIIIQRGQLKMVSRSTETMKHFDMIIFTVLKCERERPAVIVGDKLVLIPA